MGDRVELKITIYLRAIGACFWFGPYSVTDNSGLMLQTGEEEPHLSFFIGYFPDCEVCFSDFFTWKFVFISGSTEVQGTYKQYKRNGELLWKGITFSASQYHCFYSHPGEDKSPHCRMLMWKSDDARASQ